MRTAFTAPSFAWQSNSRASTQLSPPAMWKRVSVSTPIQWCEGLYLTWACAEAVVPQHSPTVVGFLAELLHDP